MITLMTAVCMCVSCLCIPFYNPKVYVGIGTPNTWHSCTQLMAMAFMVVCVPYTAWCYDCFTARRLREGQETRLPWPQAIGLGVLVFLSLLAKPTFMQAFLPACCLYFLFQWIRFPKNSRFFVQIIVCVLPAVLFMILQYLYYFGIIVPWQSSMVLEVASGKALYVGVSNYNPEQTRQMAALLWQLGTPLTIHQPRYNMLDRAFFEELEPVLQEEGIGSVCFCPLAQGLLTGKYLNGIPRDSRAASASPFLKEERITPELIEKVRRLQILAEQRGQTLAQMAVMWDLRNTLTSVIIGASRASQIKENAEALANGGFTGQELDKIDRILRDE